jgi:hypothetical protein
MEGGIQNSYTSLSVGFLYKNLLALVLRLAFRISAQLINTQAAMETFFVNK